MSIKIFKKNGNTNIFRFLNNAGTKKSARGGLSESDIDLFISCTKPSVMWIHVDAGIREAGTALNQTAAVHIKEENAGQCRPGRFPLFLYLPEQPFMCYDIVISSKRNREV